MPAAGPAARKSGPLAGLTVVEMAGLGPVPLAALMLSEMGAEVLRIERLGRDRRCLHLGLRDFWHISLCLLPLSTYNVCDLKSRGDRT